MKKESEVNIKTLKQQETSIIKIEEEKTLLENQAIKFKIHKKEEHDLEKELETQKEKYKKKK